MDGAKGAKDYGVGLWERLNGKGGGGKAVNPSELGLPVPVSIKGEVEVLADKLSIEVRAACAPSIMLPRRLPPPSILLVTPPPQGSSRPHPCIPPLPFSAPCTDRQPGEEGPGGQQGS